MSADADQAPARGARVTYGLIIAIFHALDEGGYVCPTDHARGSAVSEILRLTRIYEGRDVDGDESDR